MIEGEHEIEFGFGDCYPGMRGIDSSNLVPSDLKNLTTGKGVVGTIDFGIWQRIEADLQPPKPSFWRRAADFVASDVVPVLKNPGSLRTVLLSRHHEVMINQSPG